MVTPDDAERDRSLSVAEEESSWLPVVGAFDPAPEVTTGDISETLMCGIVRSGLGACNCVR